MNKREEIETENNIVIVGGGFAGTTLAKSLEKRIDDSHHIVLISQESYTTFQPMLPEVVGGSVFPAQIVAPIRQMIKRSQFVLGSAVNVNPAQHCVTCETLAGLRNIPYKHLVFAFGARANLALVPGMQEHALPLKLIGDAMHMRNRILERIARMELESDTVLRKWLGHFIVIGGGFNGVEVAGELCDYLRNIVRYFPRVRQDELSVTIMHSSARLLPEMPEQLGIKAMQSMVKRGIQVRLNSCAARVDEEGVELASGEYIPGATVICTIGTRPNRLVEKLGLPAVRGRIETQGDMSVKWRDNIWAAGDCALIMDVLNNQPVPPTAQFAVAQAHQLSRNIARRLRKSPSVPFRHRPRGMMATIGHMKGVAEVGGMHFSGLPAWLLWRAYYLLRMPTFGRKLRIWVEWTWSMFFTADITLLRFTRTHELLAEEASRTQSESLRVFTDE